MSDFTAQDYRQLSEALEQTEDEFFYPNEQIILVAARRFRDRYQICQTCDGTGKVCLGDPSHTSMNPDPCPDCVGGLVLNQERLEAAAKVIYDYGLPTATHDKRGRRVEFGLSMTPDLFRQGAAAAVRAFDKEPT